MTNKQKRLGILGLSGLLILAAILGFFYMKRLGTQSTSNSISSSSTSQVSSSSVPASTQSSTSQTATTTTTSNETTSSTAQETNDNTTSASVDSNIDTASTITWPQALAATGQFLGIDFNTTYLAHYIWANQDNSFTVLVQGTDDSLNAYHVTNNGSVTLNAQVNQTGALELVKQYMANQENTLTSPDFEFSITLTENVTYIVVVRSKSIMAQGGSGTLGQYQVDAFGNVAPVVY